MVTARETSLVGRVLGGRYRLDERTVGDGTSTVYLAVDVQTSRPVVVRILADDLANDAEFIRRFLGEAQVAATLDHPNLVRVDDWGVETVGERTVAYLVLERLTGGTLQDVIDRGRLLSPSQALVVGLDVCRGLDYIHRRGIVHHDIRPSAIVFGDDRRARVDHLGLSRALASDVWSNPSAVERERALYASPEQAQGLEIDDRTDVYSLVLTLVQAVTGQLPFEADSSVATLSARVDRLMPVSADLGALAAVLEKAGRPDPADRSTAGEFGRALVQVAPSLPRPAAIPIVGASAFEPSAAPLLDTAPAATPTGSSSDISPTEASLDDASTGDTSPAASPNDGQSPVGEQPGARHALRWLIGAGLVVAIVIGAMALWRSLSQTTHEVPDLSGRPASEAQNEVANFGWDIVVREEANDDIARGNVIRTEPASGRDVAEGDELVLIVSSGPAPSVLIDLAGSTERDALAALRDVGLEGEVTERPFDEKVPRGVVISWDVPDQPGQQVPGDEVLRGTKVELVVSDGPAPREVPDLVGLRAAEARASLEKLGLVFARGDDVFSPTVRRGRVVRQSVDAGERVERGSEITVRVSKGPDLVVMPRLNGLDVAEIRRELREAGLRLGTVTGKRKWTKVDASVEGQAVDPGDRVLRGSTVDVRFRKRG